MSADILRIISEKGKEAGLSDMTVTQATARRWYANEAMKIKAINEADTKQLYLSDMNIQALRDRILPGQMVLFHYDAKNKMDIKKLPYWDSYPIIFPIKLYEDSGFLGINLHYLAPEPRLKLMNALYTLAFNNKYDDKYRLQISYEILKGSVRFKLFRPCVKRYLYSHVRSQYFIVPYQDWPIAAMLPFQRFRTQTRFASARQVWEDSIRKVNSGKS